MEYPPEIMDQIVGYLVGAGGIRRFGFGQPGMIEVKNYKPTREWDRFISCEYNAPHRSNLQEDPRDNPWDTCFTYPSLRFLYSLRLVSRSWNASASRIMRRYKWFCVDIHEMASLERALQLYSRCPNYVDNISTQNLFNRFTIPLTSLCRLFHRQYDIDRARHEGKDLLGIYTDDPMSTLYPFQREILKYENELLVKLMDNLTDVRALSVIFPRAQSRSPPSYDPDGGVYSAQCYKVDWFDIAMDNILFVLRSHAFQHLVDLRLALPGTHDIGRLAAAISDNVKSQLKHLYLEVVDETGPGGSFEHFNEKDAEGTRHPREDGTLTSVGDSPYPPSNLQAQYPNRTHQNQVWEFITSCNNLESLGFHCTHYLSLERLNWKPGSNSRGLRDLYLNRVYAKTSTLINLLSARHCETEKSVARRVQFAEVKIYESGEDWSVVFDWLTDNCPRLEFFDARHIGYVRRHKHFLPIGDSSWGLGVYDNKKILSKNSTDIESIKALIQKLVEEAGGAFRYSADLLWLSCL
ncbi:hypothetical protein F5Y09DRAFT_356638 [Xylaria sp. FL1042]|nr:hypothetical protein F5Y09DRAFT_356638 [Xylaria sp. FL1042]